MSKKESKTIIIDKRVQENAEELVKLFSTIEGVDILEKKGIVRITLPERKTVIEGGNSSKETKFFGKKVRKTKFTSESEKSEVKPEQHITGIVKKQEA